MSEDEAINNVTKFMEGYRNKEQKFYDYLFSIKENEIPIQAIETILDVFKKYDAGEIISIKVLEKYYLVSKDKEKQMIYANKELFKEYIPKDEIRAKIKELEKLIETNSLYEECWNKIDVLKELLEEN
jgi:endonuclease III